MKVFTVAVVSDVHFPLEDRKYWTSAVRWLNSNKVHQIILAGDVWDLPSISSYPMDQDAPLQVAEAIQRGVEEINDLPAGGWILDGNHEARWQRMFKDWAPYLKGAKGLTFSEQTYALGLNKKKWSWTFETKHVHGLYLGTGSAKTLVRHGDHQFGSYGPKYAAASMLNRTPHVNHVFGHFHKAQMHSYTSLGETRWAVANPTLQPPQEYAKDPNWQHGFTVLEFWGGRTLNACDKVTPHLILMDKGGGFSWGGKI